MPQRLDALRFEPVPLFSAKSGRKEQKWILRLGSFRLKVSAVAT